MTDQRPAGRRAARKATRPVRPSGSAWAAVLTVVLAAGLVLTATGVGHEETVSVQRSVLPVERVVNTCLTPPGSGADQSAGQDPGQGFTVAAPLPEQARPTPQPSGGEVGVSSLGENDARPLAPEPSRAELAGFPLPATTAAHTVTATGGAAVGRSTVQTVRDAGADAAAARVCLAPRPRWWFTGAGAQPGQASTLVLANVDPGSAVVDVTVHGPDGVLPTLGTRGVTLEPGEARSFELVDLAPSAEDLAVHVEATRGRVAAGVWDVLDDGEGLEWLPAQEAASRVVRLAPLPRRAARRTLVVANPGEREQLVEVEISGREGAFAPTDAAQLRLAPGAVATADLTEAVAGPASAVIVRSSAPVAATVRSVRAGEVSYAGAAESLTGPAAAAFPAGATASVQLTAAGGGAQAAVVAYDGTGRRVADRELDLPPEGTAAWTVPRRADYVVVTPLRGRVGGGLVLTEGPSTTQVVL
jgi:hypothetical protein